MLLVVACGSGARQRSHASPPPAPPPVSPRRSRPPHRTVHASAERAALRRFARLGLPVYCGGRRGRYVALTFDDGPGPYTHLAVRIFRRARVHVTFFLVGRNLAAWPTFPRRERALGAVGDHTWTHRPLPALRHGEMVRELARTQRAVARASGAPVQLFRPPYGAHNRAVDREARALGMVEVLWNVDSGDSAGANWRQIARRVLASLRTGAIVVMHENRGQTIESVHRLLLPALRRLRYRLVSVPELLVLDPPSLAQLRAGYDGCLPRHG